MIEKEASEDAEIGGGRREGASGRAGVRIVRVPVYHRTVFEEVLSLALRAQDRLRVGGAEWELVEKGRGVAIYRRVGSDLSRVRRRLEAYEFSLYSDLMLGHFARDGQLRRRTRLHPCATGGYRPTVEATEIATPSLGGFGD